MQRHSSKVTFFITMCIYTKVYQNSFSHLTEDSQQSPPKHAPILTLHTQFFYLDSREAKESRKSYIFFDNIF